MSTEESRVWRILLPFRRFTYRTAIIQNFRCFTYVTGTSSTSPGEPPMFTNQAPWHFIFYDYTTVCCQCQPTAVLRASGSTQGGQMALSGVYFQITHRMGRPQYVWGEYLCSVLEKVEVRVTVSVSVCVVWDDDERKGEGETRCRIIACSSREAPR